MAHIIFIVRQSLVTNVDCMGTQVINKYFMILLIKKSSF